MDSCHVRYPSRPVHHPVADGDARRRVRAAYNTMAMEAHGRYQYPNQPHGLLCLSDDTEIVTPNWRDECALILANWPSDYGLLNLSETTATQTYGHMPTRGEIIESPSTLAFVATLVPSSVWSRFSGLDERFVGYGMDDTDFDLRLLHAGLRIGVVGGVTIKHTGTVAYQRANGGWEGVQRLCGISYDRFYEKWGLAVPENREMKFFGTEEHLNRSVCGCAKDVDNGKVG